MSYYYLALILLILLTGSECLQSLQTQPRSHTKPPSLSQSKVATATLKDQENAAVVPNLFPEPIKQETCLGGCSYLSNFDQYQVKKAVRFALVSLNGIPGGLSDFENSLAVAAILCGLEMDQETIIAGLLYPLLRSNTVRIGSIRAQFGDKVRDLLVNVDQLSRVEKIAQHCYVSKSVCNQRALSESLRSMLLSVSSDWNSLLLKTVMHLHDLKTAERFNPETQKIIARQALDLYAPLAHRMGVYQLKSEIENIGFKRLYPLSYSKVTTDLTKLDPVHNEILKSAVNTLKGKIRNSDVFQQTESIEISGRCKEPFSMWKKMVRQNCSVEDVLDAIAVRVVVKPGAEAYSDEVALCYKIRDVVHSLWPYNPSRSKDYIRFPKENGYQSLHSSVSVNFNGLELPVEVQVRSSNMNQAAEFGVAAHFLYKDGSKFEEEALASDVNHASDGKELIQTLHQKLKTSKVFIFGPNGTVLIYHRGATISDARKELIQKHLSSGRKSFFSKSTKVNGKKVSKTYVFGDGDILSLH